MFRSLGALVISILLCVPMSAQADPSLWARTASKSLDITEFQLRLKVSLERGTENVADGWLHPEAMEIRVRQMLHHNVGVFAQAQVGKAQSQMYAGLLLRPFVHFTCLGVPALDLSFLGIRLIDVRCTDVQAFNLDFEFGVGIGAGGLPILGGGIRLQDESIFMATSGYYHAVTGLEDETIVRFRALPPTHWAIELWLGIFGHVAGKEKLFNTFEGGPLVAWQFRWPMPWRLSAGWAFARLEYREAPRFRVWLDLLQVDSF